MYEREEIQTFSKTDVDLSNFLKNWVLTGTILFIVPIYLGNQTNNHTASWLIYLMVTGIFSILVSMFQESKNYEIFKQRLSEILFDKSFGDWLTQKEDEIKSRKQMLEDLEDLGSNFFDKIHSSALLEDRAEVLKPYKIVAQEMRSDKGLEKLTKLIDKHFPHEFIGVKTTHLNELYNEHIRIRDALNTEVNRLEKRLKELRKKFSTWDRLLELLQSFRAGIPVNLQRISQLVELDEKSTEHLLKLILEQDTNIGEYLPLEQSFIRGTFENLSIFKQEKMVQAVKSSHQICAECGQKVDLLLQNCSNCGTQLSRCDICKQGFRPEDKVSPCPSCKKPFHFTHLYEIIRLSGTCPTCKVDIKEDQIQR